MLKIPSTKRKLLKRPFPVFRVPEIDSYSDAGKKPDTKPRGLIEFKNVHFSYPSRVDVQVNDSQTLVPMISSKLELTSLSRR